MSAPQAGILAPVPPFSRYLEFIAQPDSEVASALRALAAHGLGQGMVVGLGSGLVHGLGQSIGGLRPFPSQSGPGCVVPSTQADIWCWLKGDDQGQLVHAARSVTESLAPAFRRVRTLDSFKYERGLDLTGYEDGTENPEGDAAVDAAIVAQAGAGLDGSSFVAVQQWVHDLDHFGTLAQEERDNIIGRRLSDNEELADAPVSAHVRRTAQESFDPEAFVVRRSMPWADACAEGLYFAAFGKSLDAYEALLTRMTGQEDGVVDGLFRFTRPVHGGYYWCPPSADGGLDLRAIGL